MPVTQEPPCPADHDRGPRFSKRLDHRGHTIEVAVGFDIFRDTFLFHVYIVRQQKHRVLGQPGEAATEPAAYEAGFAMGRQWLDYETAAEIGAVPVEPPPARAR